MTDEEFLKPSRDLLALIDGQIAVAEREMVENIKRYGNDAEYSYQQSREFYAKVEPLRHYRDGIAKTITDYYALQTSPPAIVIKPSHVG